MSLYDLIPSAMAQNIDATAFGNVVNPIIDNVVYPLVALAFGIAVVVFVYGVLQLILKPEDEEAKSAGKMSILWGSVGMFIMVSAWGIIYLISNTVKGI